MTKYFYISVDTETAGPNPSSYSLLTIGACTLDSPPQSFYIELKPVNAKMTPEAQGIHHLDIKRLNERGIAPAEAMEKFESWIKQVTPEGEVPLFLAFNAPFDWMFVCDYFHRFLGRNPFGHAAVDIKAFALGICQMTWDDTSIRNLSLKYLGNREFTHHALRDALDQAEIFNKLMAEKCNSGQFPDKDETPGLDL
jgi:DNA polymerase III epsilon subunit-like protein